MRAALGLLLLFFALTNPAQAELSLSLSATPDPAVPGEPISFAITVASQGAAAENVSVTFIVPAQFVGFSKDLSSEGGAFDCEWVVGGSGSCDPTEKVTWTVGDLADGEGRTLRLAPVIAAGASNVDLAVTLLENGVPVFEEEPRLQIAVAASRRLDLRLSEEHDPARPGSRLRYALRYGHPVAGDFTNGTTLRFFVPNDASFVSASEGCNEAAGIVTCALGRLWPGEGGERHVVVEFDSELADGAVVEASAELTSTTPSASARARAVTRIASDSDLGVAFTARRDPARPGEPLELELTASNRGPITLFDVDLALAIPNGVATFPDELVGSLGLASAAACEWVIGGSGNCDAREMLTLPLGDLAPGQARTVRLTPALASLASGSLVGFEAWARSGGGGTGPEFAEEAGVVLVQDDPIFDLALSEDADPVAPGQVLVYTIDAGHVATASIAEDVELRFGLPDGVTFQQASNGGQLADGIVRWPLGSLDPGERRTRTVRVTVDPLAEPDGDGLLLEAWAEIVEDAPGDAVRAESARARAVTRVASTSPLALEVRLPNPPSERGQVVEVAYRVRNVGAQTLFNVGLEGLIPTSVNNFAVGSISAPPLPSSVAPVCVWAIGGSSVCDQREHFVWTIPQLNAGQLITVTVPYTLLANVQDLPDGTVLRFAATATHANAEAPDVAVRAVPEPSTALAGLAVCLALGGLAAQRSRRRSRG